MEHSPENSVDPVEVPSSHLNGNSHDAANLQSINEEQESDQSSIDQSPIQSMEQSPIQSVEHSIEQTIEPAFEQSIEADVAAMSSLGVRAARARRSLQQTEPKPESKSAANSSLLKGKGLLLGEIPNINHRIEKTRSTSPEFKRFLSLIFPREKVQKNKLKNFAKTHFKGLTADVVDHVSAKLRQYLNEDEPPVLSKLFALMDLEFELDEDDTQSAADRNHANAMKFLLNPQPTGKDPVKLKIRAKPVKKDTGKKRSLSKKTEPPSKKQRLLEAAKKSPNPFVIFMTAQRDEVRTRFPELTIQQVTAKLGDLWRHLPADDREVYELAAKKLKEDAVLEEELKQQEEEAQQLVKKVKAKPRAPATKKKASAKQPVVTKEASESNNQSGSDSAGEEDDQSQSQSDEEDEDGSASEDTQDEDESELPMEQ